MQAQDLVDAGIYPDISTAVREALRILWQERPQVRIDVAIHRYVTEELSLAKAAALAGVSYNRMKEMLCASEGIEYSSPVKELGCTFNQHGGGRGCHDPSRLNVERGTNNEIAVDWESNAEPAGILSICGRKLSRSKLTAITGAHPELIPLSIR